MTFQEAIEEMKVLAGGRDWAFKYEVTSWDSAPKINGYISEKGINHADCSNTYQGAINNMKRLVKEGTQKMVWSKDDPAPSDTPELPELRPVEKRCSEVGG